MIALATHALRAESAVKDAGIGLGYSHLGAEELSRPYGGGISFHAMGEIAFESPDIRIGVEVGYRRSTAALDHPDFVTSAEGTLKSIPIDLIARVPLVRTGVIRPMIGAGLEILWIKESFSYRLLSQDATRNPSSRVGVGPVLAVGIDRTEFPRLRIEAIASFVSIHREVSTAEAGYGVEGSPGINAGSYGARILWRLP